ncbi:MAG: hypothetical protein U0822_24065 [Anaerolineae bacterium]
MVEFINQNKPAIDALFQLVIVIVPVAITWFIRTYVRASSRQNQLAATVRLANAAIDAIENMDRTGKLVLPSNVEKGGYKLKLATEWLESELNRNGIQMSTPDAEKWVAAEFQQRVGGVRSVGTIAELTKQAVDMIQDLGRNKLIDIPPDVDRTLYVTGLAADWLLAKLAENGVTITRDEAMSWVRAEILQRMGSQTSTLANDIPLTDLAQHAIDFVNQLKASGTLRVRAGGPNEDIENDLAIAWALTEAAKQNLSVSSEQVADAIAAAREARQGGSLPVRSAG